MYTNYYYRIDVTDGAETTVGTVNSVRTKCSGVVSSCSGGTKCTTCENGWHQRTTRDGTGLWRSCTWTGNFKLTLKCYYCGEICVATYDKDVYRTGTCEYGCSSRKAGLFNLSTGVGYLWTCPACKKQYHTGGWRHPCRKL